MSYRTDLGLRAVVILICLCLAREGFSQSTTGSILGRVTDQNGAVIQAATVSMTNEATGLTQTVQTNHDGDFLLPNLPPNSYSVNVSITGYKTATRGGIRLLIDQKLRLDFSLEVGAISETINITTEPPILQTESAETGEVIQSKQILDLPLLGRNFLELTNLTPGVVSGSGGNTLNRSINGQREFGNSVMIDGVEATANRNNDTPLRPSLDAVQEFKVLTSAYAPEFGRASGGVIAIQTKSGSNDLHGSVYEFFRPNNTAARSFFSNEPSQLKQHNFGGSVGGPVIKNRAFFFGSFEGFRLRDAFSFVDSVPPIGQIRFLPNGDVDLSGLVDPFTGNQIPIFDPNFYAQNFFAQQFPGNIIPANRVSPAGRAILQNFFPRPNLPGTFNGWFSNFRVNQRFRHDLNNIDARGDYSFSTTDNLSVVYHYAGFDALLGDRFAGAIPVDGGGDADQGDKSDSTNQSLSIAYTHLFSNGRSNELRFGYTRFRFRQVSLLDGRPVADQFGLRNINLPDFPQTLGFPNIFLGFGGSTGGSTFKPLTFLDSNFQLADNYSLRLGKHDLKVGADLRKLSSNPNFSLFPTGFQFYAGPGASLTSDPNFSFFDASAFYFNGGSDIADLLLGLPQLVTQGLQLTTPRVNSFETHFYFQDTWQATNRLVLNYGLRFEYQSPYVEESNNAANFDIATRQILLAGRGSNSRSLVKPDRNNFAPRFGLAYRITNRTVVRAGYGIFYSPENDARNEILTKNFPFAQQQDFFNDIFAFFSTGFPSYFLDTGVPRNTTINIGPDVASILPSQIPGGQVLFAIDPQFPTAYSQLFNFTFQQEISSNISAEIAYVGSLGRKLPYAVGNINLGDRISNQLGRIEAQFPIGLSNYHSLQAKVTRRFSGGFNLLAAYTFGKSIDNGPAPFNLARNNQRPQSAFDLTNERAVSSHDVRHNLVVSSLYELPFGKGKTFLNNMSGVGHAFLGGWQINAIYTLRSGLPVNVVRDNQRIGFEGLRPNLVGDPELSDRTLDRFFNTTAFSVTGLGNSPGNTGRNILRGPGFSNLDFSLFKQFGLNSLREGMDLQLRFEFFNVTNTPHFDRPNAIFSRQGEFGRITRTIGNPRIIQFAAKLNF